jgi:hypothetical protein
MSTIINPTQAAAAASATRQLMVKGLGLAATVSGSLIPVVGGLAGAGMQSRVTRGERPAASPPVAEPPL